MGNFGTLILVLLIASVGFVALFLLISAPTIVMARRVGEPDTVRRFVKAALICGIFLGITVGSSKRLTDQCLAEGNRSCYDAGATGLIAIMVLGFVLVSGVRAWKLITD